MKIRSLLLPFAAVLMLVVSGPGCNYNSIVAQDEQVNQAWADVQSQYQRRADLVPNLVNTVKGAANFEQTTLTQVTEARSRASSIQLSAEDLNDPAKIQQFQEAQAQLSQGLGRLLAVAENYPELKATDAFRDLSAQLEGTENRINITIRDYNAAVQSYNTTIRTFPDMIGAKIIHGAKPMVPFEAKPGADQAPTVDFSKG